MPHFPDSLTAEHTVLGPLGSGGRGMVWHTRCHSDGTERAVKVLHRPDPAGVARMKAEFRALARADHPAVVQPRRLWASGDLAWFSMDLVRAAVPLSRWAEGAGLRERWTDAHQVRLSSAVQRLIGAIAAIHRTGVVHRDIKPENILADGNERLFLLDLDLASPPTDTASTARILGTPAYRAPELGLGLPVGFAADWFGLGAVLYELLTGRPPFGRAPRSALRAQRGRGAPDLSTARPDLPPSLSRLIGQLLQPEPTERPTLDHLVRWFDVPRLSIPDATLEAMRRSLAHPGAWVVVNGATPALRRHALATAQPPSAWRIPIRFGTPEPTHLGPIDALGGGLARLLHGLPLDRRAKVLPRSPRPLLRVAPDLALIPELSGHRGPSLQTATNRPLAQLLAGVATLGPLTVHLEAIHHARPTELRALDEVLADSAHLLRVVVEGEQVKNTEQMAILRTLRKRFIHAHSVRCATTLQSPVKPPGS